MSLKRSLRASLKAKFIVAIIVGILCWGCFTLHESGKSGEPHKYTPSIVTEPERNSNHLQIGSYTCDAVNNKYKISSKRFVIALMYWEQLPMATASFLALVSYSKSLGARMVQPFLLHSELYGLPTTVDLPIVTGTPPINYKQPTQDLSIIYNTSTLQEMLCAKYSMPPLASFQEFITKANRELTILNIMYDNAKQGQNYSICSSESQIKSSSEKLIKTLNEEAKKHNILKQFTMKRACCIYKTISSELSKECGFNEENFSAVFMVWRGYSFDYGKMLHFRLPNVPSLEMPSPDANVFPLSNAVLSNATAFYKDMAEGKQLISIHFQTAKISNKGQHAMSCFNEVWHLVDQLKKDYSNARFKYFVDYSQFGSHSYEMSYGKAVSQKPLKERNIVLEYYKAKQYGGIEDQGFVALVEQAAIAKSDILVLLGGGSFQLKLRQRFIHMENGNKLYRVNCDQQPGHVRTSTQLVFSRN